MEPCSLFGLLVRKDGPETHGYVARLELRLSLLEGQARVVSAAAGGEQPPARPDFVRSVEAATEYTRTKGWLGASADIEWAVGLIRKDEPLPQLKGSSMGLAFAMGLTKLWAGRGEHGPRGLRSASMCSVANVAVTGELELTERANAAGEIQAVATGALKPVGGIEAKVLQLVEREELRFIDALIVPAGQEGLDDGDLHAYYVAPDRSATGGVPDQDSTWAPCFSYHCTARNRRLLVIRTDSVAQAFDRLAQCQAGTLLSL